MTRRTRRLLTSLLLLAVLFGVPVLLTWRAVRQERLNRALIVAVMESKTDTVVSLLKAGANPNARQRIGGTVSFRQAFLDIFLRFRSHSKPQRDQGDTALSLAASNMIPPRTRPLIRRVEPLIVNALLDAGANPNCRDGHQDTPLNLAVYTCSSQVKNLLDKGADVNARDDLGRSPLMIAEDPAVVRLLLDRGADVNAHDNDGASVLVNVFRYGSGSPQIVRLQLERGETVNDRDRYGYTPLMMAALQGPETACVRLLLERGANVNVQDANGMTPLMWAVSNSEANAVRVLLKGHADLNIKDRDGMMAYHFARQFSDREAVANLLKQAGAKE